MTGSAQIGDSFAKRLSPCRLRLVRRAVAYRAIRRGGIALCALPAMDAHGVGTALALMALPALGLGDAFGMREVLVMRMTGGASHRSVCADGEFLQFIVVAGAASGVVRCSGLRERSGADQE